MLQCVDSSTIKDFPSSAFTAKGKGSVPGWGTKISQAAWCGQKERKIYIYCLGVLSCLVVFDSLATPWTIYSPPGSSSVHGIFHTRILEWVAISFTRGSSPPRDWTCVSCGGRRIPYCLNHQGSPSSVLITDEEIDYSEELGNLL